MKPQLLLLCFALSALSAHAADAIVLAEDDASDPAYKSEWKAEGGGTGFAEWTFKTAQGASGESHAGFFIAETARNPDMKPVAIRDKAFGFFANGAGFEIAAAFRPLKKPLAVGQTFSFLFETGEFAKKFDQDDAAPGSVGVTLRSGNAAAGVEDYNKDARLEFGSYAGKPNYQIFDGETTQDTGVPLTSGGLTVSITLATADTYDVEITTLADKKKTTLKGRKLGGTAGAKIESFCLFNRNWEKNDAFFNGLQITGVDE